MVDTDIVSTHTYTAGGRDEQALLLLPPDAIHVSSYTISVFSYYCRRLYIFFFWRCVWGRRRVEIIF
jgi:hypothetical protein